MAKPCRGLTSGRSHLRFAMEKRVSGKGELHMCYKRMLWALLAALVVGVLTISAAAQSLTSGDITGTVRDPSGPGNRWRSRGWS